MKNEMNKRVLKKLLSKTMDIDNQLKCLQYKLKDKLEEDIQFCEGRHQHIIKNTMDAIQDMNIHSGKIVKYLTEICSKRL